MAQDNAERLAFGRTALGGAACGFSYDAATQDAVARETRLRRPLSMTLPWPGAPGANSSSSKRADAAEMAAADRSA